MHLLADPRLQSCSEALIDRPKTSFVRLKELDGIRGWAALGVLIFHFLWELFSGYIPGARNIVLGGILNGNFHVAVFFTLSGEALSYSYLAKGDQRIIVSLAIKRYLRLMIPIFFSCLPVLILMRADLVFSQQAAQITNNIWLGMFLNFEPTVFGFAKYVFFEVFSFEKKSENYNPFLWTMPIEFLGSFLVFFLLFIKNNVKKFYVFIAIIVAILVTMKTYFGCFLIGVLFAQMRIDGVFHRLQTPWSERLSWIGIVAILLTSGWLILANHTGPRPTTVTAAAFLFCVFCNKSLSNFFAKSRFSQFLGIISFPLYIVHFSVLVSLTSGLIVFLDSQNMLSSVTALAVSFVSALVSIVFAIVFTRVEHLTQAIGKRLSQLVLR